MILQRTLGPVSSPQNPEDIANKAYVDSTQFQQIIFPVVSQQSDSYSWYAMMFGRNYGPSLENSSPLPFDIEISNFAFDYRGENSSQPIGSSVTAAFTLERLMPNNTRETLYEASNLNLGAYEWDITPLSPVECMHSNAEGIPYLYYWRFETSGAIAALGTVQFTVSFKYRRI